MASRSAGLFKKQKTASKLKRRKATLETRKRVLIVSEGDVTEVEYFDALRGQLELVNVDLDICGKECDSAPISVVRYALDRAEQEGPHNKGGYNYVFCVFDRDDHESFERAVSQVLDANKPRSSFRGEKIVAITSYPCFEYWLLSHIVYSRAPFAPTKDKTVAEVVAAELRKYSPFEEYDKALTKDMIDTLLAATDRAVKNAENAIKDAEETGENNPSTRVHHLVCELRRLATSK